MKITLFTAVLFAFLTTVSPVRAHCEIPCGIYDDHARIHQMEEHASTIGKAVTQILDLKKAEAKNYNQLVRWIHTKEDHATKIQEIVSQYFLTQRIKPSMKKHYAKLLEQAHLVLTSAMKTKQSVSKESVDRLRSSISAFDKTYGKATKKIKK